MNRPALHRFMMSDEFTKGEKSFVFDYVYRMGGSFTRALFEAIAKADRMNLYKLEEVFPEEVQGYRAYAHGDLRERIQRVIGEFIA